MSKSSRPLNVADLAFAATVEALAARGWVEDGVGGAALTGNIRGVMMGRRRYHLPDTDWYATVGKQSTCLYQKVRAPKDHNPQAWTMTITFGLTLRTREQEQIGAALAAIARGETPDEPPR